MLVVGDLPTFSPTVTSFQIVGFAHTNGALSLPCPVNTKMLATIGDAALVPPITSMPPFAALNIATPVAGSATADTFEAARLVHAVWFS